MLVAKSQISAVAMASFPLRSHWASLYMISHRPHAEGTTKSSLRSHVVLDLLVFLFANEVHFPDSSVPVIKLL
jgi:hypothetical protein